jgi:hypothetical protein
MTATSRRLLALILLGVLAVTGACTYGHQEPQSGPYQPLVFPGEARLGASAFMVIDSNQFQIGDQLERYDLHRGRVQIRVEGNANSALANVRSVFAIETGRATRDAELRANSWVMVAFFDLPDATTGLFTGPYPHDALLHLEIDGTPVPALQGSIWVIGEGGQPTSMNATPLLPLLEDELEPRTMVRLRARNADSNGISPSWAHIGSISAEIRYNSACLSNPQVYTGSEAVGAGAFLGQPVVVDTSHNAVTLTMVQPRGLQLLAAGTVDPTRLGQGPILDIAFDRTQDPDLCGGTLDQYLGIRGLRVSDYDGNQLLASNPSDDSSGYFYLHYVDPERPQR